MMGMGVLPKKHPLNFGMLGNNGKPYANSAVGRADLLIRNRYLGLVREYQHYNYDSHYGGACHESCA